MALKDTREGRSIARMFERRDEDLQRLREAMAAGPRLMWLLADLTPEERRTLAVRLCSATCSASRIAAGLDGLRSEQRAYAEFAAELRGFVTEIEEG